MLFEVRFELHKPTFQFHCSRKTTTRPSGTRRHSAFADSHRPIYATATLPGGAKLDLSCIPTPSALGEKSHHDLTPRRPLRVKSCAKKFGRFFSFGLSRTHSFTDEDSQPLPTRVGKDPHQPSPDKDSPPLLARVGELQGQHWSELPGQPLPMSMSEFLMDMPELPDNSLAELDIRRHTQIGTSTRAVPPSEHRSHIGPHRNPTNPLPTQRQPQPHPQPPMQMNAYRWGLQQDASMMPSPSESPTCQKVNTPSHLITNPAASFKPQHGPTPSPTSTSTSSLSPAGLGHLSNRVSPVDGHGPYIRIPQYSPSLDGRQGHSNMSSVSGSQSSFGQGYYGSAEAFPSPTSLSPASSAPFSPSGSQGQGIAPFQSPPPQASPQAIFPATSATAMVNSAVSDAINHSIHAAGQSSPWERCRHRGSRRQRPRKVSQPLPSKQEAYLYQIDYSDPVPPYENHPANRPIAAANSAFLTDFPTPEEEVPTLECPHCRSGFSGKYCKGNLNRHILHFHSGFLRGSYPCFHCPKRYNRQDALKKHLWEKHGLGERPRKRHV